MIKTAAISLLAIFLASSCSYTPSTTARSDIITEECYIAVVDPETGTCIEVIDANEENWKVNKPICKEKFIQINKYDESKEAWWEIF